MKLASVIVYAFDMWMNGYWTRQQLEAVVEIVRDCGVTIRREQANV